MIDSIKECCDFLNQFDQNSLCAGFILCFFVTCFCGISFSLIDALKYLIDKLYSLDFGKGKKNDSNVDR